MLCKVILFGIALSFTLVNLARFLAALKLRKGDFENHINLIQRLSRDKMKGQRGGSVGDDKALLVSTFVFPAPISWASGDPETPQTIASSNIPLI